MRVNPLGAEGSSESGERVDDAAGPGGELFVAQGAVVRLEDSAQQERVDTGMLLLVAPDLYRLAALQLGDGEGINGRGDSVPLDRIGKHEREVAFDGLVTRDVVRGGPLERKLIEQSEVELGEVDGLAQLAGLALGGGKLAEASERLVVEQSNGGTSRFEPCRRAGCGEVEGCGGRRAG